MIARSPVSNLGDLLRKEPSLTVVGGPRPKSPKLIDKKFTYTGGKSEDWNTVSNAITALYQRKKLAKSELTSLTEKVKIVKQEIGGPAMSVVMNVVNIYTPQPCTHLRMSL